MAAKIAGRSLRWQKSHFKVFPLELGWEECYTDLIDNVFLSDVLT